MGGGANSSSSTSRPLTSAERFGNFAGSLAALSATAVRPEFDKAGNVINPEDVINTGRGGVGELSQYNTPDYQKMQIVDPGEVFASNLYDPGEARSSDVYDAGEARTSTIRDPGAAVRSQIYEPGNAKTSTIGTLNDAQQLAGGDYDRLEQSILQSRTAPMEYALNKAKSQADEDAAKRGIWSSGLAMRAQNDLADRFAPELRAAAAEAATQRYGLQANDLANTNNYNLNRFSSTNQANLGQDSMVNTFNTNRANNLNQANLGQNTMLNNYEANRADNLNQANLNQDNATNTYNLNRTNNLNQANQNRDNSLNTYDLNRNANLSQASLNNNQMMNNYNTSRAAALNQAAQFDSAQRNSFEMENANRRYNAGWAPANYLAGVYNGTGGQTSNGSGSGWNFNI